MSSDFGGAAPILRVADVRASLAYFIDALGFRLDWDEGGFVSVSRGQCPIFLTHWPQSQPRMWVWIGVRDCAALHGEMVSRGARVRQAPTNFPWALEMQIEDLDGNVLRIGSEPNADAPWGKFLDANAAQWDVPPLADSARS